MSTGSIRYNSSKTVLNSLKPVKIKSRETFKQRIRVVQKTNAFAAKRAASRMRYALSHLKSLISLTGLAGMAREGKI